MVLVSFVPAGLVVLVQAQGQVELGAHHRLYKPLIESLVHGVGGGRGVRSGED